MGISMIKQSTGTTSLIADESKLKLQVLADKHCRAEYPIL